MATVKNEIIAGSPHFLLPEVPCKQSENNFRVFERESNLKSINFYFEHNEMTHPHNKILSKNILHTL